MPPLQRAIALEEMDEVAVLVAEQLHLDMAGPADELLEKDVRRRRRRCRPRAGPGRGRRRACRRVRRDAHAAAAAAHRRLDDDRIAELLAPARGASSLSRPAASLPERTGTLACWAMPRAATLSPSCSRISGARADEDDARASAGPGERSVLREKAVARMDRRRLVLPGPGRRCRDVEIGANRLAGLADAIGLVRLEAVQGEAVLVRVDGDGANAQLVGRAKDANGDLAAIGDQQLANRRGRRFLRHDGSFLSGPATSARRGLS